MRINVITSLYKKYVLYISALALFSSFIFTALIGKAYKANDIL